MPHGMVDSHLLLPDGAYGHRKDDTLMRMTLGKLDMKVRQIGREGTGDNPYCMVDANANADEKIIGSLRDRYDSDRCPKTFGSCFPLNPIPFLCVTTTKDGLTKDSGRRSR